ncbi:MAG: N-acetyltransferase family protein [Steroidobacteraceae bacterium]
MDFQLRRALPEDAPAIAAIYAPYVEGTVISFEVAPPSASEITMRMEKVKLAGLPYLVAEARDGVVLAYAYAGLFHARAAYRHTVENAVYVAQDQRKQGIGTALMQRIIDDCTACDCRQMLALISGQGAEASIAMHTRLGFAPIGTLRAVGFKFGRWIDVIQMQRQLGAGDGLAARPS